MEERHRRRLAAERKSATTTATGAPSASGGQHRHPLLHQCFHRLSLKAFPRNGSTYRGSGRSCSHWPLAALPPLRMRRTLKLW